MAAYFSKTIQLLALSEMAHSADLAADKGTLTIELPFQGEYDSHSLEELAYNDKYGHLLLDLTNSDDLLEHEELPTIRQTLEAKLNNLETIHRPDQSLLLSQIGSEKKNQTSAVEMKDSNLTSSSANATGNLKKMNGSLSNSTNSSTTAMKHTRTFQAPLKSEKLYSYEAENNDQYGYPDNKVTTQNTIPSFSSTFHTKLIVGTTEGRDQTFNFLADTGSSWIWVETCGDKDQYPYWKTHQCPNSYFNAEASSTLQCTSEYKDILYGGGAGGFVSGPICQDYIRVFNTDDMKAQMPFILKNMPYSTSRGNSTNSTMQDYYSQLKFDGILGLAPKDDSAGPLLVDKLYEQEKIRSKLFSFLPSWSSKAKPKITFGGYQTENDTAPENQYFYKEEVNTISAHRIGGSFHWSLPVTKVVVSDEFILRPAVRNAMTDTGTTLLLMYWKDYKLLTKKICEHITSSVEGMSCKSYGYGYSVIQGCSKETQGQLPRLKLQIDSYYYTLRGFQYTKAVGSSKGSYIIVENEEAVSSGYCTFRFGAVSQKSWILGNAFLNDYYQVYDMTRNQVGLVPSIYVNTGYGFPNQDQTENFEELLINITCLIILLVGLTISLIVRNTYIQNNSAIAEGLEKRMADKATPDRPSLERDEARERLLE